MKTKLMKATGTIITAALPIAAAIASAAGFMWR